MNLDLGNLLSRAWKITWNNKILWIFGVLAALGNGSARSSTNFNYRTGSSDYPSGNFTLPPQVERWLNQLQQAAPTIIAIVVAIICVLLLLNLLVLLISLLGRGGLIGGARQADASGRVTFGEAWSAGTHNLVRLFVIQLPAILLGLLVFVVTIAIAAFMVVTIINNSHAYRNPAEILGPMFGLIACLFIVICPFVILNFLLEILIHFARFAAVLEDLSAVAAFRRAWEVIKNNFVSVLVLGIILIVAGFLFNLVIGLPALLIIVPAFLGIAGAYAMGQSAPLAAGIIMALIGCAIYVPVALFLRGVFETWATSAWTLAYQQFIQPAPSPASPITPYPVLPADYST